MAGAQAVPLPLASWTVVASLARVPIRLTNDTPVSPPRAPAHLERLLLGDLGCRGQTFLVGPIAQPVLCLQERSRVGDKGRQCAAWGCGGRGADGGAEVRARHDPFTSTSWTVGCVWGGQGGQGAREEEPEVAPRPGIQGEHAPPAPRRRPALGPATNSHHAPEVLFAATAACQPLHREHPRVQRGRTPIPGALEAAARGAVGGAYAQAPLEPASGFWEEAG